MQSIARRRVSTAGPALDALPEPGSGGELDMLRYLRRHPRRADPEDEHWRRDLVDGITLVRYLRGGELLALEIGFAAAAAEAKVPWQQLRAAFGVRTRQAVSSILQQRLRDRRRLDEAARAAAPDARRRRLADAWLGEQGERVLEAVRMLLEHRDGLSVAPDVREWLDDLEVGERMHRAHCEGLGAIVTDLCVVVGDLQRASGGHEPQATLALAAAARVVADYRTAVGLTAT
jgi:hypothetical protein